MIDRFGGRQVALGSFAPSERALLAARRDPHPGMAARLLARELVIEVLSAVPGALPQGVVLSDVEIVADPDGRPVLGVTAGVTEALARSVHLSITHDAAMAAAWVVMD